MNKLIYLCGFVLIVVVLSSCGTPIASTEVQVVATDEPAATETPANTEVPTETFTEVPTESPVEDNPVPVEGEALIDIAGFKFSPNSLTVKIGTTVTWTNKSFAEHTVSSDEGLFNGSLSNGGTFSFTFSEVGEYPFHCDIHPEMQGKIVVVE